MDWEECKYKKFVKEKGEDKNLVSSLIKSSARKIASNKRLELDDTTASTKISIVYEALRELLEALAIKRGFKIYNHECFCAFLTDICMDSNKGRKFDKLRKIRNQINYYGKEILGKEAKNIIKEIGLLRKNILKEYFKEGINNGKRQY